MTYCFLEWGNSGLPSHGINLRIKDGKWRRKALRFQLSNLKIMLGGRVIKIKYIQL